MCKHDPPCDGQSQSRPSTFELGLARRVANHDLGHRQFFHLADHLTTHADRAAIRRVLDRIDDQVAGTPIAPSSPGRLRCPVRSNQIVLIVPENQHDGEITSTGQRVPAPSPALVNRAGRWGKVWVDWRIHACGDLGLWLDQIQVDSPTVV